MAAASTSTHDEASRRLLIPLHVAFIEALDKKRDSLAYHFTTHLRMNGVYWGLTALEILGRPEVLDRQALIDFVFSCWDDNAGGFGSFPGHDAHVHSSLSAIQILAMKDALSELDDRGLKDRLVRFLLGLQLHNGAIQGDRWGETDTRFLYCAVSALAHLNVLDKLDRELTISHILECHNPDGGFGTGPGAESHAAQAWVCIGALSILSALDRIDADRVGGWLAERQLPNGGLNGRPQKLEDVCYSWWVLSTLSVVGRLHWINAKKLARFILSAQDPDEGGIADRPDNVTDVFHTVFGCAGLSLLGFEGLQQVDPTYCMPLKVTQKLGIERSYQRPPPIDWD
ncbi:probable BET2 - geranylgeranyltransferase type II beta subunit [Ustilago trichophora]|uniref:Geranylgeranyl transferase type-2 subunit beta n=1 Tax=Ustilago trichophora TaxID=86804 RepID=A0A5C3EB24_9BASI|nr:probable BET2 - geranylgeranyltransferase type II beta subunit [Ustilago trichophora]